MGNFIMSNLPIEVQFEIAAFEQQVKLMSREQAQETLIKLYKEYRSQKIGYNDLLAHQWGIDGILEQEEKHGNNRID